MALLVAVPLCPLYQGPSPLLPRVDEALLGTPVRPLGSLEAGFLPVCTDYGYRGWAQACCLLPHRGWETLAKATVTAPFADVLARAQIKAPVLHTLPRGAVLSPLGEQGGQPWQRVLLPGGEKGYVRTALLRFGPPHFPTRQALRASLVSAALSYLGTPYRWGGKTPQGIDCSGLTFMAYALCGLTIWRDAAIRPGYPVRPISLREAGPGDLLFFPGHVAMYRGEGRYLHATARPGSDGVVENSLLPRHPDYRPDLAHSLSAVGTVF